MFAILVILVPDVKACLFSPLSSYLSLHFEIDVVQSSACPNNCVEFKNGICNTATNTCSCVAGWTGPDCSISYTINNNNPLIIIDLLKVVSISSPFPGLGVSQILYRMLLIFLSLC